jgi:hypothetical protein
MQSLKALLPIEVNLEPLGIIAVVNPMQFWKALEPMEVTLVGILTLVKALQLVKALVPMEVTLVGIVILVNPLQL